LEISVIPKNDRQEDVNEIVMQLGQKVGVNLKKEDISRSHRLPTRVNMNRERATFPPAIIVKFTSRDVRARKVLKDVTSRSGYYEENKIFINKSLTQRNKELFKDCLKVKKDKGFKFLWTNGGKIFMRKDHSEGSRVIQITNANALRKLGEEMSHAQVVLPQCNELPQV